MISFQGGVVCQKFLLGGAVSQFREDHFDGDPSPPENRFAGQDVRPFFNMIIPMKVSHCYSFLSNEGAGGNNHLRKALFRNYILGNNKVDDISFHFGEVLLEKVSQVGSALRMAP